ncbi:Carboxylesterase NlhH [Novipirellula artificiosorum]|uniref:Carboxylesterase NlhH n=2 Tax=Novipirellula artificiosorum TaxID=2528016 RepID=A0A5C6DBS0_9BACT|nr:Carboxylesterase NlhH [Novipirellula artificiosorum]
MIARSRFALTALAGYFIAVTCALTGHASEETVAVAKVVNGMGIPIVVHQPTSGQGPYPVVFHVHGGGWNGGTSTEVPPATVGQEARILCDRLGIVFVGLAYRCKEQGGTYPLAMSDLQDSVAWFRQRAEAFNADLSRFGFSGGSAGAPLSAMMAQQTPQCRSYLGCWGIYDFTNSEESLFPDEEARRRYGLASDDEAFEASAFHHLRRPPPATLLLHGGLDILTHPSQSLRFREQIEAEGGSGQAIIFSEMNHNFMSPNNPDAFKKSVLAISRFYQEQFDLAFDEYAQFERDLDDMLDGYFPADSVDEQALLGIWEGKFESLVLSEEGRAEIINRQRRRIPAAYSTETATIEVTSNDESRTFHLRRDGRAIYEILQDERRAGMKVLYSKRK